VLPHILDFPIKGSLVVLDLVGCGLTCMADQICSIYACTWTDSVLLGRVGETIVGVVVACIDGIRQRLAKAAKVCAKSAGDDVCQPFLTLPQRCTKSFILSAMRRNN
jgi:hypothetical protein